MSMLTVKEVSQRLGVSVGYVWRMTASNPDFPKPIHLGDPQGPRRSRVTRWIEADVMAWLDKKLNAHKEDQNEDRRIGGEVYPDKGQVVETEG